MSTESDQVEILAKNNARKVKRFLNPPEFAGAALYDIVQIAGDNVTFLSSKFEGKERYAIVTKYLQTVSQVAISNGLKSIDGYYSISLNDYAEDNDFTLDFTKFPDIYQMQNYSGYLNFEDPCPIEDKKNRIVFAGTSTGNMDPAKNLRLQVCNWGMANSDFCDFWITALLQKPESVLDIYGLNLDYFFKDPLSLSEQLQYRFILSIDGNVACWDRLIWIMQSNSLAFKFKSPGIQHNLWYYPLLNNGKHFVEVDFDSLRELFLYYLANKEESKKISSQAQDFLAKYLNFATHIFYSLQLMQNVENWNG